MSGHVNPASAAAARIAGLPTGTRADRANGPIADPLLAAVRDLEDTLAALTTRLERQQTALADLIAWRDATLDDPSLAS